MQKRALYTFILLVAFCTACSSNRPIAVEKQSFVRWHENQNTLEVYAVVANSTKHDVVFEASIVMLNPNVQEAAGIEEVGIEADDRNGESPFRLAAHNETVFSRSFKTSEDLTQKMLTGGIGIKVTTAEESYTIPISYGDIE